MTLSLEIVLVTYGAAAAGLAANAEANTVFTVPPKRYNNPLEAP